MAVPEWFSVLVRASIVVEAVGLGIGVFRWSILDRARRFLAVWFIVAVLAEIMEQITRASSQNTQIVAQFWYAASGVVGLWMLAALQPNDHRRNLARAAAMGYLAVWAVLLGTAETPGEYSKFIGALHGLVLMVGAAATLTRRVILARGGLLGDRVFLMAVGLLIYAAPMVFLALSARALLAQNGATVLVYYGLRLAISLIGLLLMVGALCLPAGRGPSRSNWGVVSP